MPVELDIIRAGEFIRLDSQKLLDLETSKQALRVLAQGCLKRGINYALLDIRSIPVPPKPQFTPNELAALVRTFQEAGFSRQQRLAVLYRKDVYGGVRNFAFFSRMRGLRVEAFTEFEEALQWLSDEAEGDSESRKDEVPIPIKAQSQIEKLPIAAIKRSAGHRPIRGHAKARQ